MTLNFETWFSQKHPGISSASQRAVLKLAAEGATVPFISRYRKEQTGNLDEVQVQAVIDGNEEWNQIKKRQEYIAKEIKAQNKLTSELETKILSTYHLDQLEDLYLPYKQKRKTKAAAAKEAGLEPLAEWIWQVGQGKPVEGEKDPSKFAAGFINAEKGITDAEAALKGAQDILTERVAEMAELRQFARERLFKDGKIRSKKGESAKTPSKFENYFDHEESVTALMKPQSSHRYLAMRRGWMESELVLTVEGPEDEILRKAESMAEVAAGNPATELLKKCVKNAVKVSILPSLETEVHRTLKENADQAAIHVFAENAKKLLLAAPFGAKTVLGIDPGIRTGCKLALVESSGKYLTSIVIRLQSENEKKEAANLLKELVTRVKIDAIAIGNGTAGRETEAFVRGVIKETESSVPVIMVSEAGASIYSASEVAREEFPELDLTIRGAISIARRLQDPLAELVKADPKSIGVGQYQHDVNQGLLKKELDQVVVSCVNSVGVDLNTASKSLLSYVSGIGPATASAIVEYRGKKGIFNSRKELLEVPRFSQKIFEQASGFLRIRNSETPLDNTGVHPERYETVEGAARKLGVEVKDLLGSGVEKLKSLTELKQEVGEFTFDDIVRELEKPGRDPRENFVPFSFRDDIHEIEDLKEGMICPGIVTNVTNFGAFVDIGVHQDGLVHLSVLSNKYVKDPREVVSPGDHVTIKVLGVNKEKRQISLSMRMSEPTAGEKASGTGRSQPKSGTPRGERRHQPPQPERPKPGDGPRLQPASAAKPAARPQAPKQGGGRALPPKGPDPNSPFAKLMAMRNSLAPGGKK